MIIAAFVVLIDILALAVIVRPMLADRVSEQSAAPPTPADQPGAEEEAHQTVIIIAALVVIDTFALVVVIVRPTLPDQVGQKHAAKPSPANAAADKEAGQPVILVAAFVVINAFAQIVVVVISSVLADRVSEQGAAPPTPADQPGAEEEAHQTVIIIAALVVIDTFALVVVIVRPTLPDQVGQKHAAKPSPANAAADQDAGQPVVAVVTFIILVDILAVAFVLVTVVEKAGHKQAAHPLAAEHLAAGPHSKGGAGVAASCAILGVCHGRFLSKLPMKCDLPL